MSWSEPLAIATRLAKRLGTPVQRWPNAARAHDETLVVTADEVTDVPADRLADAAAVVVVGTDAPGTSAELTALRARVQARGVAVVLSTFATIPNTDGDPVEVPLIVASRAQDTRVADLLAAGPHALTLDAAVDVDAVGETSPPARVCVVSFEVAGMTGGGIGTASTALAETLARTGHDVTMLFTGWQEPAAAEENERWQRHYAERGVRLEIIRPPNVDTVGNPHFPARSAYEVYCWLRDRQPFDVVHVPENMGHGAYAQLAKHQGAHFAQTTFVIGTHGPTRWAAEANRVALTREEFLVNDALERTSVALADVLLGPSRYLHDYMRARGWRLPERVAVQAYAVPTAVRREIATADERADAAATDLPSEIVFFGRLETRKGVATLCDALDLLAVEDEPPAVDVTFLGPIAHVLGQPADRYIESRARRWPWTPRIISDRDQQGAAEYLARPGVLAVMPSTVDNAPNAVSEAVALGIPLIAGRTGGTGELIAAEQRDDHMFGNPPGGPLQPLPMHEVVPAPNARPLAELLRRRLATPVESARAPTASEAVDAAYDRWHRAVRLQREANAGPATTGPRDDLPSLAAIVLFDGDDGLLEAQIEALADDAGTEIVVADLRDTDEPSVAPAARRRIAVVRPALAGHGAQARAAAVAATSGELIAVVPPADVPLPGFAAALRRAAAATAAHVYGWAVLDERASAASGAPASSAGEALRHAFVPLPGPPIAGLTHPAFSAGPYAISRDALERLDGFAADARGDDVDHELLNRAAVAGLAIEVLPEPLAAKCRDDRFSRLRTRGPHDEVHAPYDAEQWLRAERMFAAEGPIAADVIGLLRGARDEALRLRRALHEQHAVYEARSAEQMAWIENLEARSAEQRAFAEEQDAEISRLNAEIVRLDSEVQRLERLTREMEQSAAQLTVRTLRDAGKKLARRARR